MIAANNKWNDEMAIKYGKIFKKYDITWYEEPVSIDDIGGANKVVEALGENHFSRWEFDHIIEQRQQDILQGDSTLMGEITEWLKVDNVDAMKISP